MAKSILDLYQKKVNSQPIISITAYDYFTSLVANSISPDFVLVGDSLGTVVKGEKDTLNVTIDEIIYHTKIVSKHIENSLIVADMPFLSFNISNSETLRNAGRIIVESNADAVKIEGANEQILDTIGFLINNNIPVMGHIGLTPQSINKIGKYKVFGKTEVEAKNLIKQAVNLEKRGVFALVLECVKKGVAKEIAQTVKIPVIGIGAGVDVDGQILVISDVLGMHNQKTARFVKKYVDLLSISKDSIKKYSDDVLNRKFPNDSTSYL